MSANISFVMPLLIPSTYHAIKLAKSKAEKGWVNILKIDFVLGFSKVIIPESITVENTINRTGKSKIGNTKFKHN